MFHFLHLKISYWLNIKVSLYLIDVTIIVTFIKNFKIYGLDFINTRGLPSLVKGAGLRTLSRRSSRVQITAPASEIILFYLTNPLRIGLKAELE